MTRILLPQHTGERKFSEYIKDFQVNGDEPLTRIPYNVQLTQKGIDFAIELTKLLDFNHYEIMSVEEHDEIISFLSQLPHAIAVALMNSHNNDSLSKFSGDSFNDLTRIAKINENLWSELFLLNKDNLINNIDAFINALNELKHRINEIL